MKQTVHGRGEAFDASRLDACLERLAQMLLDLSKVSALEAEQRKAVKASVQALFDSREHLVGTFADAIDPEVIRAYPATRREAGNLGSRKRPDQDTEDAELDEALHFFALQRLAEDCEPDSADHLHRTAGYCRAFARHLGCDATFVDDLWHAARLHDVGMIAVPREILDQRGLIDSYERVLLDTHTRAGAYLINSVIEHLGVNDGPLLLARDVALHHHERHDGLGVLGLVGEATPFASRIFHFADVYDALRRRRPHRSPLDHEAAVATIVAGNEHGAQQFDPELLGPFLECAHEFVEQHDAQPPEAWN